MSTLTSIPRRKPDDSDRRRSTRVRHVVEAWICSPTDFEKKDEIEVRSVNLSRHGIAFDLDRDVPTGSFWNINVVLGDQEIKSEIRIISCRKVDDKTHEVGAEYC